MAKDKIESGRGKTGREKQKAGKDAVLGKALRDNMQKRKAQARARALQTKDNKTGA